MLISLAVRLIIPDTTALSARRALRKAGLNDVQELRREVCWSFDVQEPGVSPATPQAVAERLLSTDVLVNYNKHRGRWWHGGLDRAAPADDGSAHAWGRLLVEDRDDPEPVRMQRILTTRLGLSGIFVRRHGTLWSVGAVVGSDVVRLTNAAAHLLLTNPHGQVGEIVGASPSPNGGNVHPAVR
ncbi:MAG TPA: hypothetical protein VIU62_02860 [Chloroflexota bacterium]